MTSKKAEESSDIVWYLDKPELKDVATKNSYLELPKLRWNPFSYTFAIGLVGAVGSLGYGLHCTLKDRRDMIQKMMEARVAFQTVAVVSVVAGMLWFNMECKKLKQKRLE